LGLAASGLGTNMIFFSMGLTQGQEKRVAGVPSPPFPFPL